MRCTCLQLLAGLASAMLGVAAAAESACPSVSGAVVFSETISYGEHEPAGDPTIAARLGEKHAKWILDTGTYPTALLQEKAAPQKAILSIANQHYRISPLQALNAGEGIFAAEIGGLISPQAISQKHFVVMDLDADCFVGVAASPRHILQTLDLLYPSVRFEAVPWIGSRDGVIFVEGSYEGGAPVTVDIDTGSRSSFFDAGYLGPVESREAGSSRNAGGIRRSVRLTLGGEVRIAGRFPLRLPVSIREDDAARQAQGIAWRGAVGMNYLKGLILVIPPMGSPAIYIGAPKARP
jgi:hypothetical protein